MADKQSNTYSNDQSGPKDIVHSRSISIIQSYRNNFSFMPPKFLLKTLQFKKRKVHKRSSSTGAAFNPSENHGHASSYDEVDERRVISQGIDKHVHGSVRSNYLLPLMPISRRVSAFMSFLSRNNKKLRDHEKHESRRPPPLVQQGCSTSSSPFRRLISGNMNNLKSMKDKLRGRRKSSRVELVKKKATVDRKKGLKIRGLNMIMRKGKTEKRFELCKKKILMGEKCRPLNGTLRYDTKGVLVAEHLAE